MTPNETITVVSIIVLYTIMLGGGFLMILDLLTDSRRGR